MRTLFVISLFLVAEATNFDPNCFGDRRPIVHLFEWPWADIAAECENYLSKYSFCGVHLSPSNEHRVIMDDKMKRPWWERYQPISYKLYSSSGDEDAFKDMLKRCNNAGVRVYADAVINHMTAQDAGVGTGVYGSPFNSQLFDFPNVPYDNSHFHKTGVHCTTKSGKIENWKDANQIRNCRHEDLDDLDQSNEAVRDQILGYMNKLVDLGVAGFRIDSARHIAPSDLQTIIDSLHTLNTTWFQPASKPYIWQEVKDVTDEASKPSDYNTYARVTEYNYRRYISDCFNAKDLLKHLASIGSGYGNLMTSSAAVVSIDTPETQRHPEKYPSSLSFQTPRQYKMAVAFMLAWNYGLPHLMSSYRWEQSLKDGVDQNAWMGPPHDKRYNTLEVTEGHQGGAICTNGWVCEHRWAPIQHMIEFNNIAADEKVMNWWDDDQNQIAFSRGDKAFFAVNGGSKNMFVTLNTGMAPGWYCNAIEGGRKPEGNSCYGSPVRVNLEGKADILIRSTDEEPIFAIHKDTQISNDPGTEPQITTTPLPTQQRTVIFLQYHTIAGQDLFLRGGISHSRRPSCDKNPVDCYIPVSYTHVSYTTKHYNGYNAWSKGDHYLDWKGVEQGQGTYNGEVAEGSPMVWTTNAPITDVGYHQLNSFGAAYWMLDVLMDCSSTENGWFELKGIIDGRWEKDIQQDKTCTGNAQLSTYYSTNNHLAKCGYKNVFVWDKNSCRIDEL